MKTTKTFWLIVGPAVLIVAVGLLITKTRPFDSRNESPYYAALVAACQQRNSSCCLASVNRMITGNYQLVPKTGCPSGYRIEMLRCVDSYRWCQPINKTFFTF